MSTLDLKSVISIVNKCIPWPCNLHLLFFFFRAEVSTSGSCLLSRCFTTGTTPPPFFAVVILEIGSHFLPGLAWTECFYFILPTITGVIGTYQHMQIFSIEMGSCKLFLLKLVWSSNLSLPSTYNYRCEPLVHSL
jgi:hypothetical protein